MPCQPRLEVVGMPYFIVQRDVDRQVVVLIIGATWNTCTCLVPMRAIWALMGSDEHLFLLSKPWIPVFARMTRGGGEMERKGSQAQDLPSPRRRALPVAPLYPMEYTQAIPNEAFRD